MAGNTNNDCNSRASLGRRLIVLVILSLLLIAALIWMTIALFGDESVLATETIGTFTLGLGDWDTLLPRLL